MQTIGERLEEARKKKGISIREAAEATKIRGDYLQKFESNHFDIGLTEIYTRGFLRTYANFLKVPADRLLHDYAALGRGDVRPRQPSREVYGRMDISVATAEAPERGPTPTEPVAAPEPSHANRGPARPRTGSSLPTGPDPAVVFKYIKWGAGAIIVLLVVLILKSLLFSGRPSSSASNTPSPAAPRGPVFTLVALKPVQVQVHRVGADGINNGEQVFSGTLNANETRVIPRPGAVFVDVNPPDSLLVEINGTRFPLPAGVARSQLQAP
jgi:cytoskeleton protein RodZ